MSRLKLRERKRIKNMGKSVKGDTGHVETSRVRREDGAQENGHGREATDSGRGTSPTQAQARLEYPQGN